MTSDTQNIETKNGQVDANFTSVDSSGTVAGIDDASIIQTLRGSLVNRITTEFDNAVDTVEVRVQHAILVAVVFFVPRIELVVGSKIASTG